VTYAEKPWYRASPLFLQNAAVSLYGLASRLMRGGRYFRRLLAELEESQWFSEEEFEALQNEKLAALIRHCYDRVPYYGKLMRDRGLTPEDIRTVSDLEKLPYVTKETLRTRGDEFVAEGARRRRLYVGRTSGTTGTPLVVYRDAHNVAFEHACIWRHWRIAGMPLWGRRATLRGDPVVPIDQKSPPFWRHNRAESQLVMSSFHLSRRNARYYVEALRAFRPICLQAYPSSAYFLAKTMLDMGERLHIDFVFTGSEPVYAVEREVIEEAFSTRVFDFYGQAERVIFAMECEEHRGLHVAPEYGIIELAEPEEPSPPGLYEIVGTSLNNFAMPILRFRTGDLTGEIERGCPCGRKMPMIPRIETRAGDMIITPEGRQVTFAGLTHAFMGLGNIKKSQIVQESLDRLRVRIVPGERFTSGDREDVVGSLKSYLGRGMKIDIELVEEIERDPSGKYRWVVSKVNPADWERRDESS